MKIIKGVKNMPEEKTVCISLAEYEQLVRDSERVAMLKNYVQGDKYVYAEVIKKILGVEEK